MPPSHTPILTRYAGSLLSLQGFLYLCLAGLFAFAYLDTFRQLWYYWIEGMNWQFLVPIAFVYMLWDRKDLYAGLPRAPSILPGLLLLLTGCALLIVGQLSSTQSLREISIVINIFGLVFLLFGTKHVRALFWPLIYLVLMLSVTSGLLGTLRHPLKLIAATVAANALQMAGYAVYRDGSFLQLPHITIEVADSCSGLNQIISSIALGIPIAFTILNKWWKRIAIILFSLMLGLVMNWIRVFLIATWNYASAKEVIHGPYDIYKMPFIFLVGVFITLAVALAIADKTDARASTGDQGISSGKVAARSADRSIVRASVVALLVFLITAVYLNTWKAEAVNLQGGFSGFPMTIAGFQGKPIDGLEKPFYTGLAPDELIASYINQANETARVYIGYFPSQNQQAELIDYRYNWLQDGAEPVELPSHPAISMKRNRVRTGDRNVTVFFSYDINGRNIIDPKLAKLATVFDALMHRHNNGAIIMVIFDKESNELSNNEQAFLRQVVNMAYDRLPGT